MKAWRLDRPSRLSLEEVPVPEPRAGSVLMRIGASTLLLHEAYSRS